MGSVVQVEYDHGINEPAPRVWCELANPSTSSSKSDISLFLDTGAGFCALEEAIIRELEPVMRGFENVEWKDYSGLTQIFAVQITLQGDSKGLVGRAVIHPYGRNNLGRDIINQYTLNLNGPEFTGTMCRD